MFLFLFGSQCDSSAISSKVHVQKEAWAYLLKRKMTSNKIGRGGEILEWEDNTPNPFIWHIQGFQILRRRGSVTFVQWN